ncbi:hypothetical protein [Pseudomonas coronafaciens]|uniref:hypothetical protein n=1 Tax=Pseudomonas coronafaciens TaxID=53409 RepID=UPI000A92E6B3|nr:hypothetical protein [Pseudomonas coronafaciens]
MKTLTYSDMRYKFYPDMQAEVPADLIVFAGDIGMLARSFMGRCALQIKGESNLSACNWVKLALEVIRARGIKWGTTVYAYLLEASSVAACFVAMAYYDVSGVSLDAATFQTPPLRASEKPGACTLLGLRGGDRHGALSQLWEYRS